VIDEEGIKTNVSGVNNMSRVNHIKEVNHICRVNHDSEVNEIGQVNDVSKVDKLRCVRCNLISNCAFFVPMTVNLFSFDGTRGRNGIGASLLVAIAIRMSRPRSLSAKIWRPALCRKSCSYC
jgi:hypothetical protein